MLRHRPATVEERARCGRFSRACARRTAKACLAGPRSSHGCLRRFGTACIDGRFLRGGRQPTPWVNVLPRLLGKLGLWHGIPSSGRCPSCCAALPAALGRAAWRAAVAPTVAVRRYAILRGWGPSARGWQCGAKPCTPLGCARATTAVQAAAARAPEALRAPRALTSPARPQEHENIGDRPSAAQGGHTEEASHGQPPASDGGGASNAVAGGAPAGGAPGGVQQLGGMSPPAPSGGPVTLPGLCRVCSAVLPTTRESQPVVTCQRSLRYANKHRFCVEHLKADQFVLAGEVVRFCQKCSRLQPIAEVRTPRRQKPRPRRRCACGAVLPN